MADVGIRLPRVTIQFCTQCKWNLRAAYFAQELLQTFSTSLGEVTLQPSTGGVFKVDIYTSAPPHPTDTSTTNFSSSSPSSSEVTTTTTHTPIWDRKTDGGFPETKELKRRVRDVIEPGRNLGHVDRDYGRKGVPAEAAVDGGLGTDTGAETLRGREGGGGGRGGGGSTAEEKERASLPDRSAGRGGSIRAGEEAGEGADRQGTHPVLPRPGDIAAEARAALAQPSDALEPEQRVWQSKESEGQLPASAGGTTPALAESRVGEGEEGRDIRPGEGVKQRCEDCQ